MQENLPRQSASGIKSANVVRHKYDARWRCQIFPSLNPTKRGSRTISWRLINLCKCCSWHYNRCCGPFPRLQRMQKFNCHSKKVQEFPHSKCTSDIKTWYITRTHMPTHAPTEQAFKLTRAKAKLACDCWAYLPHKMAFNGGRNSVFARFNHDNMQLASSEEPNYFLGATNVPAHSWPNKKQLSYAVSTVQPSLHPLFEGAKPLANPAKESSTESSR